MEIEYIREIRDTYMQMEAAKESGYQMKMITNNEIPGLLKVNSRVVNGRTRYLYRITSMMNMEDEFHKKNMDFKDLEGIMKGFSVAFSSMEDYLLDYGGLILKPECVFRDTKTGEWKFAYTDSMENSFEEGMKDFFEYVIRNINHKDIKAVTMAYGIYKRICEGNINPQDLFEYETKDDAENGEVITKRTVVETIIPEVVKEEVEEKDEMKCKLLQIVMGVYGLIAIYVVLGIFAKGIRINNLGSAVYVGLLIVLAALGYVGYRWYCNNRALFVKKVVKEIQVPYETENIKVILPRKEEVENPTMLLSEMVGEKDHMLRWQERTGEKNFRIKDLITLVGSASDRVDCVINQDGISRIHARITNEDSRFFIKDMNSTNGTRVNGKELACYELCEIKSQDRIEFGNFECIFI